MLKKIGLVLLVLLLIAGGVIFYLYSQATALPDWYAEEVATGPATAAPEPPEAADGSLQWTPTKTAAGEPSKRKELRNFHRKAAKKNPEVAKVIKSSRASFDDGVLEMGVVADLRNLPKDQLRGDQAEFFQKVHNTFPSATDREVYIGVEDPGPVLAGGNIQLGPDAKLRVGNLSYDIDSAATKLGMSPAALRKQFDDQIKALGVNPPTP